MRTLSNVAPTPEQLAILSVNRPGVELLRGAAGSGKTTTALLRLKSLIGAFVNRRRRVKSAEPVRALVLTYNRTLRGYVEELASQQVAPDPAVDLRVSTFARWAKIAIGNPPMLADFVRYNRLRSLCAALPLSSEFLVDEAEYVLGRFLPADLGSYLSARRDGRGTSPRMERPMRQHLLEEVIHPYCEWKNRTGILDWNDLAVRLSTTSLNPPLDIVIVDEAQDFSANQVRVIKRQLADPFAATFVLDTVQRIYARGFTWQEVDITIDPTRSRRLTVNYRNTIEIAQFAQALLVNVPIDDDGTIPDFSTCTRHGERPTVLVGRYSQQTAFILEWLRTSIDLSSESVAFLHPRGWFDYLRGELRRAGFCYVELTRESEWPRGTENIALSTLHSSKGLEFDHVVILGLNQEVTAHGEDQNDEQLIMLRRLLAMAIGRARESVTIGYKEEEASSLTKFLGSATYVRVSL